MSYPLHICTYCKSELVQPVKWETTNERNRWRLTRRCPECERETQSVNDAQEIDTYDIVLDNGTLELSKALKTLERENMETLVERFTQGLARDLITAEDFA